MAWLRNRYTLTLGSLAILAVSWNLYVALNNDGIIAGRVMTADQQPVGGATVVLSERSLLVSIPKGRAVTDKKGSSASPGMLAHLFYSRRTRRVRAGCRRWNSVCISKDRICLSGSLWFSRSPNKFSPRRAQRSQRN